MSRISAPSGGGGLSEIPSDSAPVSVQLASNEQVTVPTEEVWMVSGSPSSGGLQFNGNSADRIEGGTSFQKMIFPAGVDIKARESPAILQGWDVSGAVDGTPHFEINPTVPSGETWHGVIAYHASNKLQINGVQISPKMSTPESNHTLVTLPGTLEGGDTLGSGIFGGWKQ